MASYTTKDGDVLDKVCFDYYGDSTQLEAVLEANPGLADEPYILPAGVAIELPDPVSQNETEVVNLWD